MAISILNQSDNVYADPGTSFALTHTVSVGGELLLVLIGYENEDFETISSVVWDAVGANEALTEIGSGHTTADDATVHAFYIVNPTAGASKLITVTLSGSLDAAGSSIVAFTLDGVNTSSPIRDEAGDAQQTVNTLSATVTPIVSGDFLAVHANQENTGQTMDYDNSTFTVTLTQDNVDPGTAPTFHSGYGTADATTETAQVDSTISEHMAMQIVAIAQAASSSSSSSSVSSSSSSSSLSSSSSSSSLSSSSLSSSTTPGTVSWGQVTGVEEDFTRTFAGNVTSSGPTSGWAVSGSGDEEILYLINVPNCGQIVLFEPWYLGAFEAIINEDKYRTGSGEEDTWFYITASTKQGLFIGSWTMYNGVSFTSLGWVWIRLIHT